MAIRTSYLLVITTFLLLLSCAENKSKQKATERYIENNPTLLNFNVFDSELEDEISFPVWFNDSLIVSNNIKKITRSYHYLEEGTDDEEIKYRKTYEYDKKGFLMMLSIEEFYEGTLINSISFVYKSTPDEYGYTEVAVKKGSIDPNDHYQIFKKHYEENYLKYTSKDESEVKYYIFEERFWRTIAADSLLHPNEDDEMNFGRPGLINKRFKLKNKVEESEVTRIQYANNGISPSHMTRENYPFYTKRLFNYGESDKCTGYVDSLFTGDHFLNAIRTSVLYQNGVLPATIYHRHLNISGDLIYTETEKFNYEFYND